MPILSARAASIVARTALALLAGVACGALLVAAYIYGAIGEPLLFEGLFVVAIYYGVAIAVVCVPIWLIVARLGHDGPVTAAVLGFVATAAFLTLTYAAGSHPRLHLMAHTFLPYALCGAVAAVVTWWAGRKLGRG